MSLFKFLFASTAVGAVVITAPLAFEIGKFYGKKNEQKQNLEQEAFAKAEGASRVPRYKHKSVATPWSNRSGSHHPLVDNRAEDLAKESNEGTN